MISETRKAWVAGLCLVAMVALDAALVELPLSGSQQGWIKILAAGLGAFMTWRVPNAKPSLPESARHLADR